MVLGSSRSAGTTMPSPPAALTVSRPSCSLDSVRAVPTTFAPSRPAISMVARPMPLLAPVMTITLSCSRPARGSRATSVRCCTLMPFSSPLAPARDAKRVAGAPMPAPGAGFVECTARSAGGRARLRRRAAGARSSRRAIVILWTSSGPSARRSVRMCAYIHASGKSCGHAAAAVDLDRAVDDPQRDVRRGDLDRRDLRARVLVADRVHQPRGLQREQAHHLDVDARLGDPVLDVARASRPARRTSRARTRAGTSARARARPRRSCACSGGCARGRAAPGRS